MQLSKEKEKEYLKRLLLSRLRILCKQGFYGTLLMHMNFALDEKIKNIAISKKKISINPSFLDLITNEELDFSLMHEILHISLKHNFRRRNFDNKKIFDKASDIVVNSNIMKSLDLEEEITINNNTLEHVTPNGEEGYNYSVEQLYKVLYEYEIRNGNNGCDDCDEWGNKKKIKGNGKRKYDKESFDDHNIWDEEELNELDEAEWEKHTLDACETMYVRDSSNGRGTIPLCLAREYQTLKEAKTDWRTLLNNFIQEEINDYSFTPPDRRFSESQFFLPDFNDADEIVKGVLFMIDTSGSMSDKEITDAYSEIKGAIDQFGGKLQGWLGFFDAAIVEPREFTNEDELEIIRPYGGGGTDFSIVFSYVRDQMEDMNISSIVILTDGYAPFPDEEASRGIPTIWLINNDEITPPWGKIARIIDDQKINGH